MRRLTEDDIPPDYTTEEKDGVYVEFDSSGSITHFGLYREGCASEESFIISVDYDHQTSRVEKYEKRIFTANDPEETSNNGSDVEEQLLEWVDEWVQRIHYEGAHPAWECGFCGLPQTPQRRVIAGPRIYICEECIDFCAEILNDDEDEDEED